MRLIDADALKDILIDNALRGNGKLELISIIDNAPTVDTTCPNCDSGYAQGYSDGYLKGKEERTHGEWLKSDVPESILAKCSICGFDCGAYTHNFCPNCGADMRGKENE